MLQLLAISSYSYINGNYICIVWLRVATQDLLAYINACMLLYGLRARITYVPYITRQRIKHKTWGILCQQYYMRNLI